MATKNEVLKLGIDTIQGRVSGEFSAKEKSDAFIEGLRELNGGSMKLNAKTFHRGNAVFDLVEELLPYVIESGLHGDEFFMNLVDERNLKEGDQNEFYTEDKSLFVVGNIARGSQAIRRQRLNAGEKVSVPTNVHGIKVYEELSRLMAGRVDFNTFIDRVSQSYIQQMRIDVLNALEGISTSTQGLDSTYVNTGTYDADAILALIEHVEAATGMKASIYGTKTALRQLTDSVISSIDEAKSSLYNVGFYGKFYGTDEIAVNQAHLPGTDTFAFDNDKIYIIATGDKPIKLVNEGEVLIIEREATENADLTREYTMISNYGVGVLCNEKMGVYTFTH